MNSHSLQSHRTDVSAKCPEQSPGEGRLPRAPEVAPGGEGADLRERDEASGSADVGKTLSPNQGASGAATGGACEGEAHAGGAQGPLGGDCT